MFIVALLPHMRLARRTIVSNPPHFTIHYMLP